MEHGKRYTNKLVNRLVFENLKHRPVRTLLSAVVIGVQVVMILTLVGVSRGVLDDIAERARGTGADIVIYPPNSSVLTFSGSMDQRIVGVVRQQPHVALATGVLHQSVGNFESIDGINLKEFDQMSGGFEYISGGPFKKNGDLVVDETYAEQKHLKVGSHLNLFGLIWHVTGIVQPGKLSHMFTDRDYLQELYSQTGKVTIIYVKVDNSANIPTVRDELQAKLPDHKIYPMQEFISLVSVNSVPLLKTFTQIVIGVAAIVGFLVVFLSMYTAVLERTREIGILKALGASPGYILGILLRETVLLSITGTIAGILMSYGTRWLMQVLAPTFPVEIVVDWWPIAAAIALIGSLVGAIYPGLKAARQDAIEALSYD